MEDQLATSSCFVGSLDRFLDITENQNSNSSPTILPGTTSVTPERKSTLKRRSTTAKLRLSQINQESVGLMEQRVQHREDSIKKIQRLCRAFHSRIQSKNEAITRSKRLVHYKVLTHLLTLQHAKKCLAVRTLQEWWRYQCARHTAARHFKYTQQGRWTLRQSQLVEGSYCSSYITYQQLILSHC